MDAFFAAVEEKRNPDLKSKPVVIGGMGDPTKRGVVSTANYEARKYGVHSTLYLRTAHKLCPQAVFLPVVLLVFVMIGCASQQYRVIPPTKDPVNFKRLSTICAKSVMAIDPDNFSRYRVMIIEQDKINAYMGNYQIAFTNAAMKAFDDNDLYSICSHEVSHQVLGHYESKQQTAAVTNISLTVIGLVVPYVGLLNPITGAAITGYFSRDQERDADNKAVNAIVKMGFPKEQYKATLIKLRDTNPDNLGGGFLSSHPNINERIKNVDGRKE